MVSEHDKRYKYLFSHPLFVQRLLESFVKERFVHKLDFSTLEKVDKSFVTEDFKARGIGSDLEDYLQEIADIHLSAA